MTIHEPRRICLFLKEKTPVSPISRDSEEIHSWVPILESEYLLTENVWADHSPEDFHGLIITSKRALQALGNLLFELSNESDVILELL